MTHTIARTINGNNIGKAYINAYHSYIKWNLRPSRQIYWDLYEDGLLVGVFGFASGLPFGGSVAEYLKQHHCEFNQVANNIVYCLNGHQDKNAGTKFLKLCRLDAIKWWYEKYGDILKCYQTFIEPPRTGAMYKADNWECLGLTKGFSFRETRISAKTVERMTAEEIKEKHIRSIAMRDKATDITTSYTKYVIPQISETTPKLIFMKSVNDKDAQRLITERSKIYNRFFESYEVEDTKEDV